MSLRDFVRHLRDGVLARERLRHANPGAVIHSNVSFAGDPRRVRLGSRVNIFGPTCLIVLDGGGLTGSSLDVGDNTFIGEFNNIRAGGAAITIGRDCLIAQHVTIVGSNHGTAVGTPIVDQPWDGDGVIIGDDVWLGAGVVVLPGARIGDGAVIASNSVVRGAVDAMSIMGGAPARPIGKRGPR